MLALLLALTLGNVEQSYGPYARPERGGTHAVASARGRALLAWSENDAAGSARVHVVLLDASGRAVSPISILPARTPSRDALAPNVASDGASFLVVWEEALGVQQTVGVLVGADGLPAGEPRAIGGDAPIISNEYAPPRVHWTGSAYVVQTSSGYGMRVDAAGAVLGLISGFVPQATANDGSTATVRVVSTPVTNIGRPGSGSPPRHWIWSVAWRTGTREVFETLPTDVEPVAPSIIAAGDHFLVTFATPFLLHYRFTHSSRRTVQADVDRFARVHSDCAETRCVIVHSTPTGNVEGIVVDHARPQLDPQRFTAASSARIEGDPRVTMLSDTRALVTWRSSGPDGERLAGRTLHLTKPKHRATH